jgi:signal transduction histidine kinase
MKQQTETGSGQAKFRPKARLVSILGEHLIRDGTVGILELVKNGYDADACTVNVELHDLQNPEATRIIVKDDGVGMTLNQFLHEWLEPASGHKELQKKRGQRTQKGRLPLGEKGVGRFAAHKLGKSLHLITRAKNSPVEVVVEIDWGDFDDPEKFLDDVTVNWVERKPDEFPGDSSGTSLDMRGAREAWSQKDLKRLHRALTTLMSPFKGPKNFTVNLKCPEYPQYESLVPAAIFDRAHYVFTGIIDERGTLEYEYACRLPQFKPRNEKGKVNLPQSIKGWLPSDRQSQCGPFILQLYYWDRRKEYLDPVGLNKKDIDRINGVTIFRDGIRILPYGDPEDDWLGLNARRVDIPTERISTDGVVASVEINQAENPGLRDKTNREGLIENAAFVDMKDLVFEAITTVFEEEWFRDRPRKESNPASTVEAASGKLKENVRELSLQKSKITEIAGQVESIVKGGGKIPKPVHELLETVNPLIITTSTLAASANELKTAHEEIAREFDLERDVLLGMAGLGLAAERFTHEFARLTREASQNLKKLKTSLGQASPEASRYLEALEAALDALRNDILSLGPLFYVRRPTREKSLSVKRVIDNVLLLNAQQIKEARIQVEVKEKFPITVVMREGQCTQVFNNLVDNAVFWLSRKSQQDDRKLKIVIDGDSRSVLVTDNGPGVLPKYVDRLFQPFFSTKPEARAEGRGLGLYISRETLKLVGGTISLTGSSSDEEAFPTGAAFEVIFPETATRETEGRGA